MLLSEKQREFAANATHRWNFKGGAVRSGKTYLDFKWMIPLRIRERAGKDGLCLILGVTKSTIERNVLEPMRRIYGAELVGEISIDNTAWLFGEKCHCLGAEKISQVSKIRGASIKYCYGDEVADWSEDVFALLKSRLDKEYSCFDGTFNPQYPGHWLKSFLDSDADIFCQTYTIDDNPFLPETVRAEMKKEYAGSVFYNRYILGQWVAADGLVYPMFDPAVHVVDDIPPEFLRRGKYYISIDYGTSNPFSMGLWCLLDGAAVRVKEYYYDARKMRKQKTDDQYYRELEKFAKGYSVERVVIDPSAASFKTEIRNHGKFAVWNADNDVLNGVRTAGMLLNAGRIKIHRSCQDTIREFGSYFWDASAPKDAVLKENDHAMDDLRYFCATVMERELRGVGV